MFTSFIKFFVSLLVIIAISATTGCRTEERAGPEQQPSELNVERQDRELATIPLLPFGNPSNATTDVENADNFLVVRDGYTLSYNNSRGTLNWIAWRTTAADLGARRERSLFRADESLPRGFRKIQYYDYSGSGYDRGHMVPAADRFGDEKRMDETFLMTNIVPQTGGLNQFPWNKFESYARGIVRKGNEVYTIAGVYGENGRLRGKVTVPTNCWKVVVVFRRGETSITARTQIIAVDMPNVEGIEDVSWEMYKTTVRSIEAKTGLDLFSALPREFQDVIETRQMMLSR